MATPHMHFHQVLRTVESFEDLMQYLVKYAPSGKRASELAALVGKNYQVLLNEANPANDDHKLGVELAAPLAREAGALQLVAMFWARAAGGEFVSLDCIAPELADGGRAEVADRALATTEAVGLVMGVVREALGDGKLSVEECKDLTHAIWECAEALMVLDATAKAAAGGGKRE